MFKVTVQQAHGVVGVLGSGNTPALAQLCALQNFQRIARTRTISAYAARRRAALQVQTYAQMCAYYAQCQLPVTCN